MDNTLKHWGIPGMKWGVRRTPEQLGHKSGSKNKTSKDDSEEKKTPGKTNKKTSRMSDEELRTRINRLQMEEQYSNLVSRQKANSRGTVNRLLREAGENLGRQALGKVVSHMVDKMYKDDFDINDYRDADVKTMDAETVAKVAKWWKDASSINTNRSKVVA